MPFDIDPRVDFAFQRLFGVESNKPLLIDLLNAVLSPPAGQEVVDVVLLSPFNLRTFQGDKLSIVDVKARDQSGRWFLIEMQMIGHGELSKRFVFYWAEAYAGQLKDGINYSELKPTILIAFLCEAMFPEAQERHLTFRLTDERHGIRFTDDLELHTIELSKLPRRLDAASSKLDRWSYFLEYTEGQEMSQIPQTLLDDPVFQQAYSELQRMSANPDEREEYKRRLANLREEVARIESALRKGKREGKAEERTTALAEQIRFCERLLRRPRTPSEDLARLPLPELEHLAADLQQKCLDEYESDPEGSAN